MTRAELDHYGGSQGLRLDITDICNDVMEIDACLVAQELIQSMTIDYYQCKYLAPHNPGRHEVRFRKATKHDELAYSEWRSLLPLRSPVKPFVTYAIDSANDILLDAKIGKKRRIKIRALLLDELQDDDNITTL